MPSKFWSKNRTRSTTTAVGGGQPHQIPGLQDQSREQFTQRHVPQQYQHHPQQYYQGQIPQADLPAYQQQQQHFAPPPQQFNVYSGNGRESQQGTRDEQYQHLDEQELTDTQEKIKSLRGRFGLGSSTRHSLRSGSPGLTRRISLRKPEGEGDSQQSSPQEKRQSFQWSSRGTSTSNLLAVTQEEDRGQLDTPKGQIEASSIQNSPKQHYQPPAALSPASNDQTLQQQVSPLPEQYRQPIDPQQSGQQTYFPPPQLPSPQPHPAPNQARFQPQPLPNEVQSDSRQQYPSQQQTNQSQGSQQAQQPPKAPGGTVQALARSSQDSTRLPVQRVGEATAPRLARTDTDRSNSIQGIPPRETSKLPSQQAGHLSQPSASGMAPFGTNIIPPGSQGQPYKGGHASGLSDSHGRTSPQPSIGTEGRAPSEDELTQLVKDHKELREKYNKVKKYYFEKEDQVKQLQNSLAHQRLSLSKTSLDDSEYNARFTRLDGLIAQLALSIRKSWKTIPPWLAPVVNRDAMATGGREMTAVGRACISSFLVDELFDKYFHSDLDPILSAQLKTIQNNMTNLAAPCTNVEEEEALRNKIINWRLSTVEGVQDVLKSQQPLVEADQDSMLKGESAKPAASHRGQLEQALASEIFDWLAQYLVEPAPADLKGGIDMIAKSAVGITAHLSLESREVAILYPSGLIQPEVMRVETGVPALVVSMSASEESAGNSTGNGDQASEQSAGSDSKDASPADEPPIPEKKRGMFSGIMGGTKKGPPPRQQHSGNGSQSSLSQPSGISTGNKEEPSPRVRFAAFVSVQVKGKSVLYKAPVFST